MSGWLDISNTTFYNDYNGYISNQLLNVTSNVTESSENGLRVINIKENTHYRVTILMQNRFRIGCVSALTNGTNVINYICHALDTNGTTNIGSRQELEITSGTGEVFLCVYGWASSAGDTIFNTLGSITLEVMTYNVTFMDWDNTVLNIEQVQENTAALPPLPPIREGYIFDHWDRTFSCITEDLTVTAVYRTALEHTVIKIYNSAYFLTQTVDKVISSNLHDALDGECTFEFSTLADRSEGIDVNGIAEYEGWYFNIVRVTKSISSGLMVIAVSCEHISYVLNDDRYKIDSFSFTGSPTNGLSQLLSGTQFSVGTVDFTDSVTMKINTSVTRREALMQFIAILGGEIEYTGKCIGIRRHRGSETVKELMSGKNVTDIGVTHDSRSLTASYDVSFHKVADYSVGDEVHIVFIPLGVDVLTRIIAMEYNPFYRYNIRVEVGDYIPTINDSLYSIKKEVAESNEDMSEIWNAFDSFGSDYSRFQTDYDNFLNTFKEVQNLSIGETQFTVSFTDGTNAVYNYTVDSQGRITGIAKEV
ncbi:MAG: hypothetical protein VB119_13140 [Candidatus Metalachnospira sp.]|nr:hypothetical protein [Candidatus Metalachnospira sp.]